jgi:hypothetical protein
MTDSAGGKQNKQVDSKYHRVAESVDNTSKGETGIRRK